MKKALSLLLAVLMLLSMLPGALATTAGRKNCPPHDWIDDPVTSPTCTQPGLKYHVCASCGAGGQVTIPALGHDWRTASRVEPTCTDGGREVRICRRCQLQETKLLPALGHNWGDKTVKKEPTCLENGHYDQKCKRCGFTGTFQIKALGHEWGAWYIKVEAKPGQPGIKRRDCVRSDIYEEVEYNVDDPDQPDPGPGPGPGPGPDPVPDPVPDPDPEPDPGPDPDPEPDPGPDPDPDDPLPPRPDEYGVSIVLTEVSAPYYFGWAYNYDLAEEITYHFRITVTYPEPITIRDLSAFGFPVGTTGTLEGVMEQTYHVHADIATTRDALLASPGQSCIYSNVVTLQYTTADGQELQAQSNSVDVFVTCQDEAEESALVVTKTVTNTPARGFFLPGETVFFEARITNTGYKDIANCSYEDPQLGVSGLVPVALAHGDTYVIPTMPGKVVGSPTPGVTAWQEENVLIANGETEDGDPVMGMGSVTYDCRTARSGFSLRKYETGVPLTGPYYVEGEDIHYGFELTNEGDATLSGALLTDPLLGIYNEYIPDVAPGASWVSSLPHSYRVTAADVPGSVTNAAVVSQDDLSAMAQVTSPTGEGELPETVVLTKRWIGPVPERGYYVAGDKVNFALILTNYRKTDIVGTITITDVLDAGFVRTYTDLEPGKSVMDIFTYTVTDADVAAGKVINWGYARYEDVNLIKSNVVTVPCGKPDSILGGETWCERTLTGHGEGTDTYAQTYCTEHIAVKDQAAGLPAAEAAALWREAVDNLYIRWIEQVALNEDLYLHARTERTTFLALCDILAENQTEAGAVALAKLLEDKCTDLCYVLNTPLTEPRKDVLSDAVDALTLPAPADRCLCAADAQDVTTASLCAKHAGIPAQAAALLAQSASPSDAMRYGALISEAYGYQTAANRLNSPAAKALTAYLEAVRANLGDFYGNGTLLAGELTARTAREVLLAICAGQ